VSRRQGPPPVAWQELFRSWEVASLTGGIPMASAVTFTDIRVPSSRGALWPGEPVVDWWPTTQVANRRAAMAGEVMGGLWTTRKGTLHTAELLHTCEGNPEAQAAVLIGASLWDKQHELPETWRGDTHALLQQMQRAIFYAPDGPFTQHNLSVWHQAMRSALPVNTMGDDLAGCVRPRDYGDLVSIALLDAALSTSTWTLVIVSHDDRGIRTV
jgi:hypothetical protein